MSASQIDNGNGKLAGRVAVVTGAGRGIGAAVARAFAGEGAAVAVLDVRREDAERTAATLPRAVAITCDIADSRAVDAAFAQVVQAFGTLDILANVAGISTSMALWERISAANAKRQVEFRDARRITTPIESTVNITDGEWQRMLDVNLTGTFYCTRAALRIMGPKRSGVIINTASNTAITGWAGIPHYCASKGGVLSFTRAVAQEVITQGIRVNVVAPGGVDTPMMAEKPAGFNPGVTAPLPIGRVARAEELASVYVFLASDDSSYMVGETVNVNGGAHTV